MNFEGRALITRATRASVLLSLHVSPHYFLRYLFLLHQRQADIALKNSWLKFAKINFLVHAFSVLAIFAIILLICSNHYYEYMYAYKHASKELEYKYLLACIWEGQEGSFLLWAIWHAVIGGVLIFRTKDPAKNIWQAPVMTVISVAQFFLLLMILGIYVFNMYASGTALSPSPGMRLPHPFSVSPIT